MIDVTNVVTLSPPIEVAQKSAATAASTSCQMPFDKVLKNISDKEVDEDVNLKKGKEKETNQIEDFSKEANGYVTQFDNRNNTEDTVKSDSTRISIDGEQKSTNQMEQKTLTSTDKYASISEQEESTIKTVTTSLFVEDLDTPPVVTKQQTENIETKTAVSNLANDLQTQVPLQKSITKENGLAPVQNLVENEGEVEELKISVSDPTKGESDKSAALKIKNIDVKGSNINNGNEQSNTSNLNFQNQPIVDSKNIEDNSNLPQKTTFEEKGEKTTKYSTVNTSPPDIKVTSDQTAIPAVMTNTQVKEPARLAEAQKSQIVNQVANELNGMIKTNRSSIRLQLYPAELGHIDVKITSTKNGVGVTMIADKASTQQVLSSEMNNLRQTIEQAGIQVDHLHIANEQTQNKQNQFQEQHDFSNQSRGYQNESRNERFDEKKKNWVQLKSSEIDYVI